MAMFAGRSSGGGAALPSYDAAQQFSSISSSFSSSSSSQQQKQQQQQQQQQQQHAAPRRERLSAVVLDQEELDNVDELATLASLFRATELLEKCFTSGLVQPEEYTSRCSMLITQFKALEKSLIAAGLITSADEFYRQYLNVPGNRNKCNKAYVRLVKEGHPATFDGGTSHVINLEAVSLISENFCTLSDAVQLEMKNMDQLMPLLLELKMNLGKITGLPPDFAAKVKAQFWMEKLHALRADEEISEEDRRALGTSCDFISIPRGMRLTFSSPFSLPFLPPPHPTRAHTHAHSSNQASTLSCLRAHGATGHRPTEGKRDGPCGWSMLCVMCVQRRFVIRCRSKFVVLCPM